MTNRLILILGLSVLGLLLALPGIAQENPPQPETTQEAPAEGLEIEVPLEGEQSEAEGAPVAPGAPTLSAIIEPAGPEAESTAEATAEVDAPAEPAVQVATISECPTLVQEGFTATEQVCASLNPGEACVGNGTVNATSSVPIDGFNFSSGGNRTQLVNIEELRLRTTGTANTVWTIVRSRILLNTTGEDDAVNADMVVFGDVEILDRGELTDSNAARPASVIANFGLNVRREPNTSGVVVYQLSPGEEIIATGITADREWLRIQIPTRFAGTGWVYATYMEVEGGAESLPFVRQGDPPPNLTAPDFGPMQAFDFRSATTPQGCETTNLDSGILMQSPGGIPGAVRVLINEVELQLSGTAFVQAQAGASLQVSVLEGQVTVIASGNAQTARAGERATVPLSENLNPTGVPSLGTFNAGALAQLPTRLLQRPVTLSGSGDTAAQPQTPPQAEQPTLDQIDEVLNEAAAQPAQPAPAGACILSVPDGPAAQTRRGPDNAFGVLSRLLPGDQPQADGLTFGSGGVVWFRLVQGGWVSTELVVETENCLSLPAVDAPEIPASDSSQAQPVAPTSAPATSNTTTADTSAPADAVPVTTTSGLASSTLGEVCSAGLVTDSGTPADGAQTVTLGGTWSVRAGTTVRLDSQGGQILGDVTDFIQIITTGGELLAGSGGNRSLTYTFSQDQTFVTDFAAVGNALVIMSARCVS